MTIPLPDAASSTPLASQPDAAPVAPPTQPVPALRINGLTKVFGNMCAVNNLWLQVPAGAMFGLVGPNGAGKTTTLSMCTGLLRPTAGSAEVWGHDVWSDPVEAKRHFGVLPDGLRMFDRLSGKELILFCGRLRGLPDQVVQERAESLLQALGLLNDANKLVCDYSAGMTKKIGLACALVHNPKLLILDEPFEAVDPVSGEAIRQLLRDIVAGGGTVVMSSHVMELVQSLCDGVGIIAQGRVLAAGRMSDITQGASLQQRFVEMVGGGAQLSGEGLSWLGHSSDSN